MKRSIRDVSRWTLFTGRESLGHLYACDEDSAESRLTDEVYDRLLNGPAENLPQNEWHQSGPAAEVFHAVAEQMPEFTSLCDTTRGNVALSAAAASKVVGVVKAHMAEAERKRIAEERERAKAERERQKAEKANPPQPQPQGQPGQNQGPQGQQGQPQPQGQQQGQSQQGQPGQQQGQGGQPQNQGQGNGQQQGQGQSGSGQPGQGQGQGQGAGQGQGQGQGGAPSQGNAQGSAQGQGSGVGTASGGSRGQAQDTGDAPTPSSSYSGGLNPQALGRMLKAAVTNASTLVDDVSEALDALEGTGLGCGTGDGIPSYKRAVMLAQRLQDDPRLRRIADLAGKFKRVSAEKRKSKAPAGAEVAVGIEMGDDITELVPEELLRLMDPDFEVVALRDIADGRALVNHYEDQSEMGGGPIVVLVDKSGSMGDDGGYKDVWATAVAVALCDHARQGRRPFALATFDSMVMSSEVVMPGDEMSDNVLVSPRGGTNLNRALAHGLDLIAKAQEAGSVLRKADVILVTDGEGNVNDQTLDLRKAAKEAKVTIHGIGIGLTSATCIEAWVDSFAGLTNAQAKAGDLPDDLADSLFSKPQAGVSVEAMEQQKQEAGHVHQY